MPDFSPSGFKWCNGCQRRRRRSSFYTARHKKQGIQSRCKDCNKAKALAYHQANRAHCIARKKAWHRKHPADKEAVRDRMYRRSYGYTLAQYNKQLAAQEGVCPLCRRPPDPEDGRRYALDHCHTTGLMRGVLCSACNGGLGCFRDDVDRLLRAAAYLEEWARLHAQEEENARLLK